MLFVQIYLDDHRYVLSTSNVIEIVPGVRLTPMPGIPSYIPGLCSYRRLSVPVIDLCELFLNRSASKKLSTRIIFVNSSRKGKGNKIIGLLVEKATETLKLDEETFVHSGVKNNNMPFIGPVVSDDSGLITRILTEEIFDMVDGELLFGAA